MHLRLTVSAAARQRGDEGMSGPSHVQRMGLLLVIYVLESMFLNSGLKIPGCFVQHRALCEVPRTLDPPP